jgi:hypothetical protein
MGVRRREPNHYFGQRACDGVAFQLGRQTNVESPEVERGEEMQLAMVLEQKLRLAFA